MSPKEALEFGLIDDILQHPPRPGEEEPAKEPSDHTSVQGWLLTTNLLLEKSPYRRNGTAFFPIQEGCTWEKLYIVSNKSCICEFFIFEHKSIFPTKVMWYWLKLAKRSISPYSYQLIFPGCWLVMNSQFPYLQFPITIVYWVAWFQCTIGKEVVSGNTFLVKSENVPNNTE